MKRHFLFFIFTIILMFPLLALCQQANNEKYSNLEVLDYPQSFAELFKKFEGRVVYIDLMALWCKPCIEELKESKKLQSYFEDNNIVKIYITIDNKEDIEKAFKMIENESLSGYFISYHPIGESATNSKFTKEIEALFMTDKNGNPDISIPKYAIVNKKGEIVIHRAEKPSNFASLKKQLEKYI